VSGCPSTVTDVDTLSVVAPSPGGAYGYTCTNQLPNGIGLGNIVEPAGTVLIFEAVPEVDTGTYNGSTFRTGDFTSAAGYALTAAQCKSNRGYTCQNSGYLPMHGGGMDNWLYCDGHVKSHQPIQAAYPFPNPIPATGNDYRLTEFLVTHCRSGSSICP
jgi:prepilin-type processing-associated H-X9-DG protein